MQVVYWKSKRSDLLNKENSQYRRVAVEEERKETRLEDCGGQPEQSAGFTAVNLGEAKESRKTSPLPTCSDPHDSFRIGKH